ncbi:MAG: hypothetical protein HYV15_05270, partial [Elusimicrobia bacterium]|nr:hypothetical protein [Elusimicrobiota bacterium]
MVDVLALLVHHVVVVEQLLADVEVVRLDPALGALDLAADQRRLDGLVLGHPELRHQALDALRAEQPHQLVVESQVEARLARVALASAAAAQLVVDAPRVVALGTHHVEPAQPDD